MTRNEYLARLDDELRQRGVADAGDIVEEYRQHFEYKLADGRSEAEIAARLGDPAQLAAQFESSGRETPSAVKKGFAMTGLGLVDLLAGLVFLVAAAFGVVLFAAAVCFAATGVCLLLDCSPFSLIPRPSALAFALTLFALAVLTASAAVWYAAFLRQAARAFCRMQRNVRAEFSGSASLPALPLAPQLSSRCARVLRKSVLASLLVFVIGLAAGMALSAALSGTFAFWHAWRWFGYAGH